jgi:hypothetical protein
MIYYGILISSGSSIRILYPRESYDSWEDPFEFIRVPQNVVMPA